MQTLTAVLRSTGRIVAGGLLALVAVMFVGQAGDWQAMSISEWRQFAVFVVCQIGFLIQSLPPWRQNRRAVAGGAVSLLATVAFYLMNNNTSGQWPDG